MWLFRNRSRRRLCNWRERRKHSQELRFHLRSLSLIPRTAIKFVRGGQSIRRFLWRLVWRDWKQKQKKDLSFNSFDRMKHERTGSIHDNAKLIQAVIDEEDRNWIPSKGVETFNFRGSQLRDLDWWYTDNWWTDYLYLSRPDWFEVTVQRCHLWFKNEYTYWTVYIERNVTDRTYWIPWNLVRDNQWTCHTFRWVRSLRHALKLWELWTELLLGLANPEEYFLTEEEYDKMWKLHE